MNRPGEDDDDESVDNNNSTEERDEENRPPSNVMRANLHEVSDFSTVTAGTTGGKESLDVGQRRRVALYLKEEGWKKHKFAIKGRHKAHILFQVNPELLEDLYGINNIREDQESERKRLKYPLMTAFEAGLATTRSNKIQAIKTKYFGTYGSGMNDTI
jgi:hypothetical protein